MDKHKGMLDTKIAFRLLNEIAEHNPVALVPFFRGEPLLHPDVIEILKHAKELSIGPLQFTSNAVLLDTEMTEKLLDLNIDFISFSLDTADPQIYEQSRRGSNYEKVLGNILHFIKRRKELNLKLPEIQVSAINTITYREKLNDFITFWKDKVERVRIYIEHSQDGNPGSIAEPLRAFQHRLPCQKPFTDMVVYWDGQVAACNHDWTRPYEKSLGDLKVNSIEAIWNGRLYQELRQRHESGDLEGEKPCDKCDHWKMYYLETGFLGRLFINGEEIKA